MTSIRDDDVTSVLLTLVRQFFPAKLDGKSYIPWAVAVAQLVAMWLPSPEFCSLNLVIGKFYFQSNVLNLH